MTSAATMRNIAKGVKKKLPDGWGFCVLVFPFNRPGISNYISSGERSDMITAMRETANRLEGKEDFPTPEDN